MLRNIPRLYDPQQLLLLTNKQLFRIHSGLHFQFCSNNTTPEKFENGVFTLKTSQVFSVLLPQYVG